MEKIEHFSHAHPLLLKEEQKKDGQVICSGCEEPISGHCYCCTECNYVLHKSCAALPTQMKHPMHPQHPLTLLSASPYSGRYICDACKEVHNNFVYHCSLCQYDLDMACASLWRPDDGHKHVFISLRKPQCFVCYACGEEGESVPFLCTICQIWVHSCCAALPHTIKIKGHRHRLELTYSLHQVYGFKDIICQACNKTMSAGFAGYFCSKCRYPSHLKCQEQSKDDSEEDYEIDHYSESVESYEGHPKGFIVHDHALTFVEEQNLQYGDQLCDACIRPIRSPLFACAENCGFLVHQSCAELPKTKQHWFHPHPLTLLSKAPHYDGIYRCDSCKSLSNGFVYRCDECQFDLDVCCGLLPETVKHESHKHPLLLQKSKTSRLCKGCNLRSKHVFVCDVCEEFAIDSGCATLPSTAWHVYDKHPLRLAYAVEDHLGLGECNCGICKEKRSPKQWFYYCDDCDFAAHPYCVLGKSRHVKFGGSFKYDYHSHPLTFVEEIRQHPPCDACGEPCVGWAFECGQCKFCIHREGNCSWEQYKQSAPYLTYSRSTRDRYAANVWAATPNVSTK